ncbi:hypothetical protein [Helicobacter sp. T3_23-1059]
MFINVKFKLDFIQAVLKSTLSNHKILVFGFCIISAKIYENLKHW